MDHNTRQIKKVRVEEEGGIIAIDSEATGGKHLQTIIVESPLLPEEYLKQHQTIPRKTGTVKVERGKKGRFAKVERKKK